MLREHFEYKFNLWNSLGSDSELWSGKWRSYTLVATIGLVTSPVICIE